MHPVALRVPLRFLRRPLEVEISQYLRDKLPDLHDADVLPDACAHSTTKLSQIVRLIINIRQRMNSPQRTPDPSPSAAQDSPLAIALVGNPPHHRRRHLCHGGPRVH